MTNRNMLSTIACKTCHTACSHSVVDSRLLSTLQLPTWSCHLPPTSPTKHSYNCSQLVYNPFRFQLWTRHQQYWYHITSEHLKTGNHYNTHTAPTHWPMRYPANKSLNETILLHFIYIFISPTKGSTVCDCWTYISTTIRQALFDNSSQRDDIAVHTTQWVVCLPCQRAVRFPTSLLPLAEFHAPAQWRQNNCHTTKAVTRGCFGR